MKILVTGAAGFIGSKLSEELALRGDEVVGLDVLNNYYAVSLKKDRLQRIADTLKDKPVNGKLTQGENLADLGGLQISLATCKDDAEKRECMLSWGKIWRANVRKEYAQQMLVVDPHSPPRLRINGILQHIGDFYRIFDVKEENTLFLDLDKRCMLWSE